MDLLNRVLNTITEIYFAVFRSVPSLGLVVASVLAGMLALVMIRLLGDPKRVEAAKRRAQAHLMELLIFDDPVVIWRAQKGLVFHNVGYIGHMLIPALGMSLPLVLMMTRLDAYYGYQKLAVGKVAIVTMTMAGDGDASRELPVLTAPEGIQVETPAVRVLPLRQVSWRIRATGAASGDLRIRVGAETVAKRIEAGEGASMISRLRGSSWTDALLHPVEPRMSVAGVQSVEVNYKAAEVSMGGVTTHWLVWFLLVSMVAGYVLKNPFGVVL